jgi:hypothetical protein
MLYMLLSVISFIHCKPLRAQSLVTSEYNHRRYGIPDGLQTEMVECIFQDSRGFLWFGTEHGVACFDGSVFKKYLTDKSLPINKIEENDKGEILIYGYYFIYVLNPKTDELRLSFRDRNLNYEVHQSRGLPISPPADPRRTPARERGRALWAGRRGQLDLSCAQCHDDNAGRRLAGIVIPQGHPTGYPLYRLEWQSLGSLQRRLRGCMTAVRAEPFAYGAPEYVEIELYLAQRAAGMEIETPAIRP